MPISDQSNQSWVIEQLKPLELTTMLDVGAGAGTYAHVFAQHFPNVNRFAVEAWTPYINEFELQMLYTEVFNRDIRDHKYFTYDIVIFGDVLEHMSKDDAIDVFAKFKPVCKYFIISIPIVKWPQEALDGNPYEVHVKDDWSHDEVMETFPSVGAFFSGQQIGVYVLKGDL
jgi:2-polyprenyl-3-methyl-5-hydroxy-6-metoxy-1,4-benzoquinol methylase